MKHVSACWLTTAQSTALKRIPLTQLFFLSMNHQHQSQIFKRDLTFHLVKKEMCCYISKIFNPTFYFFFWLAFCPTLVTTHKRK